MCCERSQRRGWNLCPSTFALLSFGNGEPSEVLEKLVQFRLPRGDTLINSGIFFQQIFVLGTELVEGNRITKYMRTETESDTHICAIQIDLPFIY